ncbi:hypothetical protein FD733_02110 [Pantoea sp. Eser]|nr:hypothetical protein [Pantoea sp. Eser]
MNELAATAKAFLLDNQEATNEELNAHLKSMALTFLTDKVEDYWSGLEVDHIHDAECDLRSLAKESMTVDQQAHIIKALEVLQAARSRAHSGDTQPLLAVLSSLGSTEGIATANLEENQAVSHPCRIHTDALEFAELSEMYINEHAINLKPASLRDIESAHKALKLFTTGIDWKTHTRAEVSAMRDAMRESGRYADATVNKLMAKLCAVINWAYQIWSH